MHLYGGRLLQKRRYWYFGSYGPSVLLNSCIQNWFNDDVNLLESAICGCIMWMSGLMYKFLFSFSFPSFSCRKLKYNSGSCWEQGWFVRGEAGASRSMLTCFSSSTFNTFMSYHICFCSCSHIHSLVVSHPKLLHFYWPTKCFRVVGNRGRWVCTDFLMQPG